MTLLTTDATELTVAELHDLTPDDFNQLYIEVSRRVEPGAGAYNGVTFLTVSDPASKFSNVADALAFLDDLQSDGLPAAIRGLSDEPMTDEDVVEELQYSHSDLTATEYLDQIEVHDPFNLEITPYKETLHEASTEKAGHEVPADT